MNRKVASEGLGTRELENPLGTAQPTAPEGILARWRGVLPAII